MAGIADVDQQMFDFLGNHAGFAAAGTGQHQKRPTQIIYSGLLLGIEFHKTIGEMCLEQDYNIGQKIRPSEKQIHFSDGLFRFQLNLIGN